MISSITTPPPFKPEQRNPLLLPDTAPQFRGFILAIADVASRAADHTKNRDAAQHMRAGTAEILDAFAALEREAANAA